VKLFVSDKQSSGLFIFRLIGMKKIYFITLLSSLILVILPGTVIYGGETSLFPYSFDYPVINGGSAGNKIVSDEMHPFLTNNGVSYSFEEKDADYEESQLRRFEIVFFISLPASLFFSLAGAAVYKAASGEPVSFTSLDYGYLLLSSVSISFSIALRDNRMVFHKGRL